MIVFDAITVFYFNNYLYSLVFHIKTIAALPWHVSGSA